MHLLKIISRYVLFVILCASIIISNTFVIITNLCYTKHFRINWVSFPLLFSFPLRSLLQLTHIYSSISVYRCSPMYWFFGPLPTKIRGLTVRNMSVIQLTYFLWLNPCRESELSCRHVVFFSTPRPLPVSFIAGKAALLLDRHTAHANGRSRSTAREE